MSSITPPTTQDSSQTPPELQPKVQMNCSKLEPSKVTRSFQRVNLEGQSITVETQKIGKVTHTLQHGKYHQRLRSQLQALKNARKQRRERDDSTQLDPSKKV